MSPVIRVDHEVWEWLKNQAQPLEDTPNSVLRRVAGLEGRKARDATRKASVTSAPDSRRSSASGRRRSGTVLARQRTNYGRVLNDQWNVAARHALYHKEGNYYNHLRYFPGALFDPNGYLVFKTEQEYRKSPHLQHGAQLHVPGGISSVPGYVRRAGS